MGEHRRLPKAEELATALRVSERTALHELASFKAMHKKIDPVTSSTQKTVKKVPRKAKKNYIVLILKAFLILLSAMAFCLSVYFTGLWFSGRFPLWVAGAISLTMVLFMVIAPQTMRFIKNKLIKGVVLLSFSVALVFSMGSTIAGQYNKSTEIIENSIDRSFIYNQLVDNKKEVQELIDEAQEDKKIHQETLRMLSGSQEDRLKNWQSIATERKYISNYDQRIDQLRVELSNVRGEQVSNGNIEEKRDFYLFVSGLTGMEKSFTEFLISALPAIFIDIISALCLNLALFIKGGKL